MVFSLLKPRSASAEDAGKVKQRSTSPRIFGQERLFHIHIFPCSLVWILKPANRTFIYSNHQKVYKNVQCSKYNIHVLSIVYSCVLFPCKCVQTEVHLEYSDRVESPSAAFNKASVPFRKKILLYFYMDWNKVIFNTSFL